MKKLGEKEIKKNPAKYFSHDSNARRNPSIMKMLKKYGAKGYGIFWFLIEDMRETIDYRIKLDDIDGLAYDYRIDVFELREFIHYCIDECQLFKKDNINFWSDTFLERMSIMEEKKKNKIKAGKKGAENKWKNSKKHIGNNHLLLEKDMAE